MASLDIYNWLLGVATIIASAGVGYFVRSVNGENRASVRSMNAKAGSDEVSTEKTAFELARSVMADLAKIREDYETVIKDLETERKARGELERKYEDERGARIELEARVGKLENEKNDLQQKVIALEVENNELKRQMKRKGLRQ
jgi:chromosome segregation ATPase